MIPNIYPVALSTQAMFNDDFFGTEFEKAVFIWNPNDPYIAPIPGNTNQGAYIGFDPENGVSINAALSRSSDGDAVIAPFQGFYIRRTDASEERRENVDGANIGGLATQPAVPVGNTSDDQVTKTLETVRIKPSYRSSCDITSHYKTTAQIADIVLLRVTDNQYGFIDETELAFAGHYTDEIDATFDIKKFAGGESFPSLFSLVEEQALVINKMAIPYRTKSILLGFYSDKAKSSYSISAPRNDQDYNLYLEDKMTGAWHDLTEKPYEFENNLSFGLDRFELHFNNGLRKIVRNSEILIWSSDNGINIDFERFADGFAEVVISDVMGKILYEETKVRTDVVKFIPMDDRNMSKLIIVSVRSANMSESVKLIR